MYTYHTLLEQQVLVLIHHHLEFLNKMPRSKFEYFICFVQVFLRQYWLIVTMVSVKQMTETHCYYANSRSINLELLTEAIV